MKHINYWKSFEAMVSDRPDYRTWLHCTDPKEKALRQEITRLIVQLEANASDVKNFPMPIEMTETHIERASLHINQNMVFYDFVETLFENLLCKNDDENLCLLFSFLDMHSHLLACELALYET